MFKSIKRYFALRKARSRFIIMGLGIDAIDRVFTRKNVSRRERRRFWHDFISNPEFRKKFIKEMKIEL